MSRQQPRRTVRATSLAVVVVVGLSCVWVSGSAASPEDEIARLDRARANLFEELVRARAEVASSRAELDAAIKARDAAEAELARLKQEAASAKPVITTPSVPTQAKPQMQAPSAAASAKSRRTGSVAAVTGLAPRTVAGGAQHQIVRASPAPRTVLSSAKPASRRPAAPVARAQELPSVLRLQGPQ
jgi:hypothetical protein